MAPWAGNTSSLTLPGRRRGAGGAANVVVVVTAGVTPAGRHSVWPGWITVAVVAPLAFIRAVIVTLAFVEIRYHESPLTTVYVAPGQAGPDGADCLGDGGDRDDADREDDDGEEPAAAGRRSSRAPPAEFVAY